MNPLERALSGLGLLALLAGSSVAQEGARPRLQLELLNTGILAPHQAADLELRLANPGAAAAPGIPWIEPQQATRLTFHLLRGGEETAVAEPFLRTRHEEGLPPFRTLEPGALETARYRLAVDWASEAWLFTAPGRYEVWASLTLADGTALETGRRTVVVEPAPPERERELERLKRIPAWKYVYAPHAVTFAADAERGVEELLEFRDEYPDSPWATDLPYLAAVFLDHQALVSLRDDPAAAAAASDRARALLEAYLAEPAAAYREEALALYERRYRDR